MCIMEELIWTTIPNLRVSFMHLVVGPSLLDPGMARCTWFSFDHTAVLGIYYS